MPVSRLTNELYILPSFYSMLMGNQFSAESIDKIEEKYKTGNYDQYTEIKGNDSTSNLLLSFRKIRYIPLSNSEIDYYDDKWDFSSYVVSNQSHKVLNFQGVPKEFKDVMKDQILLMILLGTNKLSTIRRCFTNLKVFFNYCHNNGVVDIDQIDENIVGNFLDSLNVATETYLSYQNVIKKFLFYYDAEYKTTVYTSQIANLCKRMDNKQYKAYKRNTQRPSIPKEYFNEFLQLLIDTMNDENQRELDRGYAAILIIESQTGLRASELSLLTADSVETIDLDGETARMINYRIIKTAHGEGNTIPAKTYLNDLAYTAYDFLMKLFEENRKNRNSNYLFCSKKSLLPHSSDTYIRYVRQICTYNFDRLNNISKKYKEFLCGKITIKSFCKERYKYPTWKKTKLINYIHSDISDDTVIYYPLVHQFRDTVVQSLLDEGVNIEYIRQYMGHLSAETTAGYADYDKEKLQENKKYSDNILKAYVSDNEHILGNNGQAMMDAIDKTIKENNLNVYKDLDGVINALEKLIPIRAKHGGVCIKGSKLSDACSIDSDTDEFFCAYGICPNLCHFYFMLDVAYSDFKAEIDVYKYNADNGFKRQARKERKKINALIVNRLDPEIEDLEREISINGIENIKKRHSNIADIIDDLDDIKKEISQWKLVQI